MIDSNGTYQSVGSKITVLAANLDKPDIGDLEFLQTGMASKAPAASGLKLPSGGTMARVVFKTGKQSPGILKLMGEFRSDQNKGQLLPALQINTDHGVVSIPVDQLVPRQLMNQRKQLESPPEEPGQVRRTNVSGRHTRLVTPEVLISRSLPVSFPKPGFVSAGPQVF